MPQTPPPEPPRQSPPTKTLDVRGYLCPIPARKAEQAMADLNPGEVLEIIGDDPVMVIDIPAWCDENGHRVIRCNRTNQTIHYTVTKG